MLKYACFQVYVSQNYTPASPEGIKLVTCLVTLVWRVATSKLNSLLTRALTTANNFH